MIIHTSDFVQGNLTYEEKDGKHLLKDDENTIELNIGDEIIWVNKTRCQSWIQTGIITKFGSAGQAERVECGIVTVNLEAECYVGIVSHIIMD